MKIFIEFTFKSGHVKTISQESKEISNEEMIEDVDTLKNHFKTNFKDNLDGNFYIENGGKHTVVRLSDISMVDIWYEP